MSRTRSLLAIPAALALLLTGCAAEPGDSTTQPTAPAHPTPAPSASDTTPTPTPSKSPSEGIPTGDALVAWGEIALPADSLGGSAPLLRETASLTPALEEIEKELDLPAGSWLLGVACVGAPTISLDVDVNGQDYDERDAIACAATAADPVEASRVQLQGPVKVRFEVETDQPAGVVFQIVETAADN